MKNRRVRIKDGELRHELFHFVAGFVQGQQGVRADFRTRHYGYKLDQGLVRNSGGVIFESAMQNIASNSLLLRMTGVEPVDEHICINEEGHDRKVPLSSNHDPRAG